MDVPHEYAIAGRIPIALPERERTAEPGLAWRKEKDREADRASRSFTRTESQVV